MELEMLLFCLEELSESGKRHDPPAQRRGPLEAGPNCPKSALQQHMLGCVFTSLQLHPWKVRVLQVFYNEDVWKNLLKQVPIFEDLVCVQIVYSWSNPTNIPA